MTDSRRKGADGERELARILKGYGFKSRRGQYKAMEQSVRDAVSGEMPLVIHRRNKKPWKVTMLLKDWIELYHKSGEGG